VDADGEFLVSNARLASPGAGERLEVEQADCDPDWTGSRALGLAFVTLAARFLPAGVHLFQGGESCWQIWRREDRESP